MSIIEDVQSVRGRVETLESRVQTLEDRLVELATARRPPEPTPEPTPADEPSIFPALTSMLGHEACAVPPSLRHAAQQDLQTLLNLRLDLLAHNAQLRQQVEDQARALREAHAAREVAQAHVRGMQRQLDNAPATAEIERLRRALHTIADQARSAASTGRIVVPAPPDADPPTPTPVPGAPT